MPFPNPSFMDSDHLPTEMCPSDQYQIWGEARSWCMCAQEMLGVLLTGWLEEVTFNANFMCSSWTSKCLWSVSGTPWISHTGGVCSATCNSKTCHKQVHAPWDFPELSGLAGKMENFWTWSQGLSHPDFVHCWICDLENSLLPLGSLASLSVIQRQYQDYKATVRNKGSVRARLLGCFLFCFVLVTADSLRALLVS